MGDAAAGLKLRALHADTRARLAAAGIAEATLDARLLVEHFSNTSLADAIASPDRPVEAAAVEAVRAAADRRVAGEPVHRIMGYREFHGMRLSLSADTLEPRPDTEALVDLVLPFVRRRAQERGGCRILDLGTGTGAIALALLKAVPGATALGVDISAGAVATALANAHMNDLSDRFAAQESDWFEQVEGRFDVIVCNPPYISTEEAGDLAVEVTGYDPHRALFAGADGLDAYRAIMAEMPAHLAADGLAALEIGAGQKDAVTAIAMKAGLRSAGFARDLGGVERVLAFQHGNSACGGPEITLGKRADCG